MNNVLETELPFAEKIGRGKVRDLYILGEDLLLVTTDRLSAFDVVMQEGIPGKGRVLTELAAFWFDKLGDVVPNHYLSHDVDSWDDVPDQYKDQLRGRTMRCQRCEPLPVEWVVRGYLTGSGWKDYQATGVVSGITLSEGLQHASQIEPAILTPSTKAEEGHDLPISFEQTVELVGAEVAEQARDAALALYNRGRDFARERGIVIADTKFEFGLLNGELILIDECLTADSSRFWPAEEVVPGGNPTSFDKQVMRDYLSSTDWNKQPPPPPLPQAVIDQTADTYQEILRRLTD
ncbi:MAG: phosphoribosylaminoimidazolesuccinocarboxamide synthase [Planctomycetota bacterium]|nr:phosphoribosylaminoimidazolesuccinocarboxamide synthase [Planctomycetota bacterium]